VKLTKAARLEFIGYGLKPKELEKLEGYLVATLKIVDCTKKTPRGQRDWAHPGPWHFILKDVKVLRTPIPMKGQLGIWKIMRRKT
jgi:hypothetical protein